MRLFPRNAAPTPATESTAGRQEVLRRYEITVEREFLGIWEPSAASTATFCSACGRVVSMMPPEIAAIVIGTNVRLVYRWIEEQRIHFVEPTPGRLLVCCDSLRNLIGFTLEAGASNSNQDGTHIKDQGTQESQ